ncbi:hypothetical protein OC845_005621 [Tilletia horrida]|nr:hypothetical protein OC845_005621 [Tilletia horrida]
MPSPIFDSGWHAVPNEEQPGERPQTSSTVYHDQPWTPSNESRFSHDSDLEKDDDTIAPGKETQQVRNPRIPLHTRSSSGCLFEHSPISKADARKRAFYNAQTLTTILGGWSVLLLGSVMFKLIAMKENLPAPDVIVNWMGNHPQMSIQVWTMIGNVLAELCLILWATSISYLAFRAVVFNKHRVELLTLSAWSELRRGGYTISGRKPVWPAFTLAVWVGALFLSPGFTTLITPTPLEYNISYWNIHEVDQTSRGFSTTYMNRYGTDQDISGSNCTHSVTTKEKDSDKVVNQLCDPAQSGVLDMLQASKAAVLQYLNQTTTNFPLPSGEVFSGRTWGILPQGPYGFTYLSDANLRVRPLGSPAPENLSEQVLKDVVLILLSTSTYDLNQQGLSADVDCYPTTDQELENIRQGRSPERPDQYLASVQCPQSASGVTSSNKSHTLYIIPITTSSFESKMNITTCVFTPFWHETLVSYSTPSEPLIAVKPALAKRTLCSGIQSVEQGDNCEDGLAQRNMTLQIFGHISNMATMFNLATGFQYNTGDPSSADAAAINNTSIISGNAWLIHLSNLLFSVPTYPTSATIPVDIIATSLQAMFDYQSTMDRAYQTAALLRVGQDDHKWVLDSQFNDLSVTRSMEGVWHAQTLGWGRGTGANKLTPTIVLVSLIPLLLFALVSAAMAIWGHVKYREKPAYYGRFDPCDITQSIIAASAGGLRHRFDPEAISATKDLGSALKVKVRLGVVYNEDEEPRMGYVVVDQHAVNESTKI